MAICRTCGHDLPSSFFRGESDQCPACRAASMNPATSQPVPTVARRQHPPVTTTLMALNIAVFLVMVLSGISPIDPNTLQLLKWGANYGPLALGSQPWRIFTSNYLHGGIIHLALNMWCLWNLGALAERIFERWTYVLAYTACGIAGGVVSLWWHPSVVGVGASGAIFGLAGALIAALYFGKLPVPRQAIQGTLRSLLTFAGYNLFFGSVAAGIDNSAHIGGLVAGLGLGAALAPHLTSLPEVRNSWRRWVFIGMAVLLFAGFTYVKKSKAYVAQRASASDALDRGDYDQAIAELEAETARTPGDAPSHALLGTSYLQKKQYDKAEASLKRALALQPKYPYAEYWLGVLYETTDRHEDARKVLTTLVEEDPKQGAALVLLGYTLEKLHRDPEALAMYSRAVVVNPESSDAQRAWGSLLLKSGKTAEAITHLQEAIRLDPKDVDTELALARAYTAQGMKQEADAALQKARELREAASTKP